MCRFITAAVSAEADLAALQAIAQRHGRRLLPTSNPSIERQLGPGLRYCLTTPAHCDCDTPLGGRLRDRVKDPAEAVQRMRRKGWSEAKIERALAQQRSARETHAPAQDSCAPWLEFIRDMLSQPRSTRFGLLMCWYSGQLDDDVVLADRHSVPLASLDLQLLDSMREGVLYEFRR
ncbi:MAG: hypothetical protein HOQ32_08160 [Lysobacter sp.]|nr:hypothetical protein [Lysobacter sp.]